MGERPQNATPEQPTGETNLSNNLSNIETILGDNPGLPVLFVSDPENGDLFEFGTLEELQNELEAHLSNGADAELTTSDDLLSRLDFETYETPPRIRI